MGQKVVIELPEGDEDFTVMHGIAVIAGYESAEKGGQPALRTVAIQDISLWSAEGLLAVAHRRMSRLMDGVWKASQ